jgi:putative ABC transport system substrate-binding protein
MRRRSFFSVVGGALAFGSLSASAQTTKMPRIGLLSSTAPDEAYLGPFRQGLNEFGFVQGLNVEFEYRGARGQYERLSKLAAELVDLKVALIVATGGPITAIAAKEATQSIPIVFGNGSDPVKDGIVSLLNRPNGNITGVSFYSSLVVAKRLEQLHRIVPNATAIGVILNPGNPTARRYFGETEEVAQTRGLKLVPLPASTAQDVAALPEAIERQPMGALLIVADAYLCTRRDQLVAIAAQTALPASYFLREFVSAGGLLSFGGDFNASYRQLGRYVGRLLKGEAIEQLPVQLATKFEFAVNLKTARALGISIPPVILASADEIIE